MENIFPSKEDKLNSFKHQFDIRKLSIFQIKYTSIVCLCTFECLRAYNNIKHVQSCTRRYSLALTQLFYLQQKLSTQKHPDIPRTVTK